jgi:hypothetical protein
VLIDNVVKDMVIKVEYSINKYSIIATFEGYGYISPKGEVVVTSAATAVKSCDSA